MKRLLSIIICILLLCGIAVPVSAAGDAPIITLHPQSATYPEYSVASYTVKATGTNLSCTWYIEYNGVTYNMSDNRNPQEPWEGYAGESYGGVKEGSGTFTWFFSGIGAELSGAKVWAVIEDGHYDAVSEKAVISVQGSAMPPKIVDVPTELHVNQCDLGELRCVAQSVDGSQLTFQWYETATGKLQDIRAIDDESADYLFVDTNLIGTRYYVCGIFSARGGITYSNVIPVTVTAGPVIDPPTIKTTKLPDAVVGEKYSVQLDSTDKNAIFNVYYNPGHKNEFGDTGLYMADDGELSGTPKKVGKFTFTICAGNDAGEGYMEYTLTVKEKTASKPVESSKVTESSEVPESSLESEPASEPTESEPEASMEESQPEEDGDPQDPGFPIWGIALIAVGAVGIGGGTGFVLFKVLKKK